MPVTTAIWCFYEHVIKAVINMQKSCKKKS